MFCWVGIQLIKWLALDQDCYSWVLALSLKKTIWLLGAGRNIFQVKNLLDMFLRLVVPSFLPPFLHLQVVIKMVAILYSFVEVNELIHIKWLEHCPAHSKCLVNVCDYNNEIIIGLTALREIFMCHFPTECFLVTCLCNDLVSVPPTSIFEVTEAGLMLFHSVFPASAKHRNYFRELSSLCQLGCYQTLAWALLLRSGCKSHLIPSWGIYTYSSEH